MEFAAALFALLVVCAGLVVGSVLVHRRQLSRKPRNNVAAAVRDASPFLRMSGTQLARCVKEGGVSSAELVEMMVQHIERVNPLLNAMVATRFEEARTEARKADDALQQAVKAGRISDLSLFHGVPCTVKECYQVPNMPFTTGLKSRCTVQVTETATAVRRLQEAGCIVLGVSNTSELCMWMETSNSVYGRTSNPYDTHRGVGGSSGGEGALVSSCCSPFGLGSDVGGSIRMPAFFNGIFGHKPTGGSIPNTHTWPPTANMVQRFCQPGPMARHSEDLWPLLCTLHGPCPGDSKCLDPFLHQGPSPDQVDISRLRVYSIEDNGAFTNSKVDQELVLAQRRVAQHLQSLGCTVQVLKVPEALPALKESLSIWSSMLGDENAQSFRSLLQGNSERPVWVLWELFKFPFGLSDFTLPALGLALIERFTEMSPWLTRRNIRMGKELQQQVQQLLGDHDGSPGILLYPSYPKICPMHTDPLWRPLDFVYTAVWNVMETPVTQVPLGLNGDGVPLGIQVVAALRNDSASIAVACELEKAFGGWQPPEMRFSNIN